MHIELSESWLVNLSHVTMELKHDIAQLQCNITFDKVDIANFILSSYWSFL